jgi:hypothetical protein
MEISKNSRIRLDKILALYLAKALYKTSTGCHQVEPNHEVCPLMHLKKEKPIFLITP